jgi:hypothetical protein
MENFGGPGSCLHVLRRKARDRSRVLREVRTPNPVGRSRRASALGARAVGGDPHGVGRWITALGSTDGSQRIAGGFGSSSSRQRLDEAGHGGERRLAASPLDLFEVPRGSSARGRVRASDDESDAQDPVSRKGAGGFDADHAPGAAGGPHEPRAEESLNIGSAFRRALTSASPAAAGSAGCASAARGASGHHAKVGRR